LGASALLSKLATNTLDYCAQVAAKGCSMPTPGAAAAEIQSALPPPPPSPFSLPPDPPADAGATVGAAAIGGRSTKEKFSASIS